MRFAGPLTSAGGVTFRAAMPAKRTMFAAPFSPPPHAGLPCRLPARLAESNSFFHYQPTIATVVCAVLCLNRCWQ